MTTSPDIVGLVLNYRDPSRTARCLASILEQGATHVLVWDNSEDSGASAAALAEMLSDSSSVSIHVSEFNLGFAAGVNRGIEHIRERFGEAWVLLLNNDARLLPGAITQLKDALRNKPDAAISYPDIDHAGRVLGTVYYHRLTGLLGPRPLPGSFPYASGCCQLIAQERLTGPVFDEDFFMYGEDWLQGWVLGAERMAHVAQTLVYHEGSQSSGMGSSFYETRINAAHWMLARKIARNPLDLRVLNLARWCSLLSRGLLRTLRFHDPGPIKAFALGKSLAEKKTFHPNAGKVE